jgi:uncharacterized Fe-S cluster-containing protein
LRKLTHKVIKAESKAVQDLKKLSQEEFACEADAIKALSKLSKQFKYHQINVSIVNWNKDRDFILSLLPDDCLRYYQLVS